MLGKYWRKNYKQVTHVVVLLIFFLGFSGNRLFSEGFSSFSQEHLEAEHNQIIHLDVGVVFVVSPLLHLKPPVISTNIYSPMFLKNSNVH